uniref:Uncharacterized protein n=1 Tax=Rhizophora mucronata TaxID=61149 RepID=A0A2P2NDE7_RHIMU
MNLLAIVQIKWVRK